MLATFPGRAVRAGHLGRFSHAVAISYGNVYTQLLEYIVSADLIFYALMVAAVIVMRRKAAQLERPYRTFGYPLVPLIYILLAGLFVLDLAYLAPLTAGIGYLLVLSGIPIYFIWARLARSTTRHPSP